MRTKIFTAVILFFLSLPLFAQPFTVISWVPIQNFENSPFHLFPYEKNTIDSYPLSSNMGDIYEINFDSIWDMIPSIYNIDNLTLNDGTTDPFLNDPENFNTVFKSCYDEQNLYLLFTLTDKNFVLDDQSRKLVFMYQPTNIDRYEDGFILSDDNTERNHQYGRFIELGGTLVSVDEMNIYDNLSSSGHDGSWTNSLQEKSSYGYRWITEPDGIQKLIFSINYADNMRYMINPWGEKVSENINYLQPKIGDTISFDIYNNGMINDQRIEYCWNSKDHLVYALVYFAGYLHFDDDGLPGVYIPRDTYPICQNSPELPVSIEGENIKWYSDTINRIFSTEPPVPPTQYPDTITYIYTTTKNETESDFNALKVIIYNIKINLPDTLYTHCGDMTSVLGSVRNNLLNEEINYTWDDMEGGIFTDQIYTWEALQKSHQVLVNAESAGGCITNDSVTIISTAPVEHCQIAKIDGEAELMRIYIDSTNSELMNSMALIRSFESNNLNLYNTDFSDPEFVYVDTLYSGPEPSLAYLLLLEDVCGNNISSEKHSPIQLSYINSTPSEFKLSWTAYSGRVEGRYHLYRGVHGIPDQEIFEVSPHIKSYNDYFDEMDTLYYQVVADLYNLYENSDYNKARSNILAIPPKTPFIDTIFVYDTITVYRSVTDTLIIDVMFSGINENLPSRILVFPNPTNELITIRTEEFQYSPNYRIKIINSTGVLVYETYLEQLEYTIDLDEFGEKGLYFLQLFDPDGELMDVRKIVLQ